MSTAVEARTFLTNRSTLKSNKSHWFVERPIEIVEYQRQTHECVHCGCTETAKWSNDIIPAQDLGVGLQGLVGWLGNYAHVPYAKIRELLFELGQIDIGEGTLVATNARVAQAIEPIVEQLGAWVKNSQPNVHIDETPWQVLGIKEWLWVIANPQCAFISCSRYTLACRTRTNLGNRVSRSPIKR